MEGIWLSDGESVERLMLQKLPMMVKMPMPFIFLRGFLRDLDYGYFFSLVHGINKFKV